MRKIILGSFVMVSSLFLTSCADDCDPGQLPQDDRIVLNLKNANGTGFLKYSGNALPDSVKVTNIITNTVVNRFLASDSILVIEEYNKTGGAVNRYKISKGTFLKPDTLEITIARVDVDDLCGTPYNVARFGTFKVNNNVRCSNCFYNTIVEYTR
jgi:hypothetical protein